MARRPRTDYVARLVGLNLLAGRAKAIGCCWPLEDPWSWRSQLGDVHVAFRPTAVSLFVHRPDGSPRNLWAGRIAALEPHGEGVRMEIAEAPDRGSSILAEITPSAVADLELRAGSEVWASVKASDVEVYSLITSCERFIAALAASVGNRAPAARRRSEQTRCISGATRLYRLRATTTAGDSKRDARAAQNRGRDSRGAFPSRVRQLDRRRAAGRFTLGSGEPRPER